MNAKRQVEAKAKELGATFAASKTRTVSFEDLARAQRRFISFQRLQWTDGNRWQELKDFAAGVGLILTDSL